jgi:hypothetical protein
LSLRGRFVAIEPQPALDPLVKVHARPSVRMWDLLTVDVGSFRSRIDVGLSKSGSETARLGPKKGVGGTLLQLGCL